VLVAVALAFPGVAARAAETRDGWLGTWALERVAACSGAADYAACRKSVGRVLLARAACGKLESLEALNELVYAHRLAGALPAAERTGGRAFAAWLVANRPVTRRLMRALDDVPAPEDGLRRLHALWRSGEGRVRAFPGLAVAFATVGDAYERPGQAGRASLDACFGYYTRRGAAFRYDPSKLPYELARYLADTRLAIAEREWAVRRYGGAGVPAKCYFDVQYDRAHSYQGRPKKMEGRPYTLANLEKHGGVCLDQAYYAAHVCKALGIPATIVMGRGTSGIGHAWVAALAATDRRRGAVWDVRTGRYATHNYYTGTVRDPASGETFLDSGLILAGNCLAQPMSQREEADAALYTGRLLHAQADASWKPDAAPLARAATAYAANGRESGRRRAPMSWARVERRTQLECVEALLGASIRRNLAQKKAWDFLVSLRKSGFLPAARLNPFFDLLIERTSRTFPEFSCRLVLEVVPTVEDRRKRIRLYRACLRQYGKRPDLAGGILLAIGDEYLAQGNAAKALETYSEGARKASRVPNVALAATKKAEDLLCRAGREQAAVQLYQQLLAGVKRHRTVQFREETMHYRLSMRLAALYRRMGRNAQAASIVKDLNRR
jgi:hypothetical protein